MKLREAGLALLKQYEGFRAKTYLDVHGLPTIGYGHKLHNGETFPDGITLGQGLDLLIADANQAIASVTRLVGVELTQGQFDALVDFVYNLGAERLEGSTLLHALNLKEYDLAAEQLLRWDHSGGVEIAGLKARREAEYKLWYEVHTPPQAPAPNAAAVPAKPSGDGASPEATRGAK